MVGIRPGEKLHEVMISEDDARTTLELKDRFVIEPLFDFWSRSHYENYGARKVADGFRYASNNNTEWLDIDGICDLLQRLRQERA
jgi:UDP-N-acetylglucosamine 4,6-dehydratase